MILWQRYASAAWLAANEAKLEEIARLNLAIIARPGRRQDIVQVVCRRRARAEMLRRKFGGRIEALSEDWRLARPLRRPIRIGRSLEIVSELSGPMSGRSQLVVPAATAFGTGEHVTTAMSLRMLEETARKLPGDWRLLDAGTGSGILALAARKFGAKEAIGIDNDPSAIANAHRNAQNNRIRRVRFAIADILRFGSRRRYDVVTANLFSEVLISAMPIFHRLLRANGCLIVSGILRDQAPSVTAALARSRFHFAKQRRRGKWVALLASRKRS
jgi:ribosomal protein L11 methyltransferase